MRFRSPSRPYGLAGPSSCGTDAYTGIGPDDTRNGRSVSTSVPADVKKNTPAPPPSSGPYEPSSPTARFVHWPPEPHDTFTSVDVICDAVEDTFPEIT